MGAISFSGIVIVSCGTMSLELNYLKAEGFLDTPQIYYTRPGLHQDIPDWMGIPVMPYAITLDRFKSLLAGQAVKLKAGD